VLTTTTPTRHVHTRGMRLPVLCDGAVNRAHAHAFFHGCMGTQSKLLVADSPMQTSTCRSSSHPTPPHTNTQDRQHAQQAMARPSKVPPAAAPIAFLKRKSKGSSLWSSLFFKRPGLVAMGILSLAFCVVISVWRPLTPEQFARQWYVYGS